MSTTHAFFLKVLTFNFPKIKSNILLQCSVSVSEEPLSETSFQRLRHGQLANHFANSSRELTLLSEMEYRTQLPYHE